MAGHLVPASSSTAGRSSSSTPTTMPTSDRRRSLPPSAGRGKLDDLFRDEDEVKLTAIREDTAVDKELLAEAR